MQFIDLSAQQKRIKSTIRCQYPNGSIPWQVHHGTGGWRTWKRNWQILWVSRMRLGAPLGTDALLMALMAFNVGSRRCDFHNTFYIYSHRRGD